MVNIFKYSIFLLFILTANCGGDSAPITKVDADTPSIPVKPPPEEQEEIAKDEFTLEKLIDEWGFSKKYYASNTHSIPACKINPLLNIRISSTEFPDLPANPFSKDEKYAASLDISFDSEVQQKFFGLISIKGRGNSTWSFAKKPYRIAHTDKNTLLDITGIATKSDWTLLANHIDKTHIRNVLAFCMGEVIGLEYNPKSWPSLLKINDQKRGIYTLTEHVTVEDTRVLLVDSTKPDVTDEVWLIEMDRWNGTEEENERFTTVPTNSLYTISQPYTIKSQYRKIGNKFIKLQNGEHESPTSKNPASIKAEIETMESILLSDDTSAAKNKIDLKSLVNLWLINEISKNADAFFVSSTFLHKKNDGLIYFGPLWDFDISFGNSINTSSHSAYIAEPHGWYTLNHPYLSKLFCSKENRKLATDQFDLLKKSNNNIHQFIINYSKQINENQPISATEIDNQIWNTFDTTREFTGHTQANYDSGIEYLRLWLSARMVWIDEQLSQWDESPPYSCNDAAVI